MSDKFTPVPAADPVKGTIIRRVIRGHVRFYHQWREDGKTKSRYLKPAEVLPLREQLEKARTPHGDSPLQNASCFMPHASCPGDSPHQNASCFMFHVSCLSELAYSVSKLRPRAALRDAQTFLAASPNGAILLVHGLPSTGKSTLLKKIIQESSPEELKISTYISIVWGQSPADFLSGIDSLVHAGYRRFLIDGLDRAPELKGTVPVLADAFASLGVVFILAFRDSQGTVPSNSVGTVPSNSVGTDPSNSPGTVPAEMLHASCSMLHVQETDPSEMLHASCFMLHASCLPGTVPVKSIGMSAIDYRDFRAITGIREIGRYLAEAGPGDGEIPLRRELEAIVAADTLAMLKSWGERHGHRRSAARVGHDIAKIAARLEETMPAKPDEAAIRALVELGLVLTAEEDAILTVPRIRTALGEKLIDRLIEDDIAAHLGAAERKIVRDLVREDMKARIFADAVLAELIRRRKSPQIDVFRVRFPFGGFDAVVADREELTCELYEARFSAGREDRDLINLTDQVKLDTIEHRYGMIVSREVVYLGRDAIHSSGVAYRNAEKFMLG